MMFPLRFRHFCRAFPRFQLQSLRLDASKPGRRNAPGKACRYKKGMPPNIPVRKMTSAKHTVDHGPNLNCGSGKVG